MTFSFDLSKLAEAEKDALILDLAAQLQGAHELIADPKSQIEGLEKSLGKPLKTSRNSSTPPSQDRKANMSKGKRKRRKGHPGIAHTLDATPDKVVDGVAKTCPHCAITLLATDQKPVPIYDLQQWRDHGTGT